MEVYGYRKRVVKAALEDLLKRFTASGKVNWKILKGTVQSELKSVELQHRVCRQTD